ncbi:MAG: hypothetical protein WCX88_02080 [Patescibacteria group bacterium]
MPYQKENNTWSTTEKMDCLLSEKKSAIELKKRKLPDWDESYLLYRNKVKINRLTQKQAVNIPLMKETIKTLLSRVDDAPEIDWKELSNDEGKELVYQEVWNDQAKKNKFELIDILDKKNVLLYGFSARKLNITKDGVSVSVLDPYDISFDPLMNAWSLESARFIVITNIFRSVREILADERYTKEGRDEIRIWADSSVGIVQGKANEEELKKKEERLKGMGVESSQFALFAGGDTIVNLTEHYTNIWDEKKKKFVKRVVVYADDKIELLNETLMDLLGVDFWPFVVWSEDPETNDIYPDSVADLVRVPNKVLNVWFSQMIENRTLKNFQMHWYSPIQGYTPQTYTPGPGVMLPAPPGDDINKVIKPVEINGLEDTMLAINAVTSIVERGSGATAIEKGQAEKGNQTLGEIEILVGKASERATAMAKFYKMSWYELAWKWDKIMHANAPKLLKLYKIGKNGKAFPKTVLQKDWKSEAGYEPIVRSSSEQETESTKGIQRFMFILQQFPNNIPLRKIAQKRMLEIVDLSPEELRQVEDGEKEIENQNTQMPENNTEPNLLQDVQNKMQQLQTT